METAPIFPMWGRREGSQVGVGIEPLPHSWGGGAVGADTWGYEGLPFSHWLRIPRTCRDLGPEEAWVSGGDLWLGRGHSFAESSPRGAVCTVSLPGPQMSQNAFLPLRGLFIGGGGHHTGLCLIKNFSRL